MPDQSWTVSLGDLATKVGHQVRPDDVERAFRRLGGHVTVKCSDDVCDVTWRQSTGSGNPVESAVTWLKAGDYDDALIALETFLAAEPERPDILYNLGMAHSDRQHLDRAGDLLTRLVSSEPESVNGRVALAVALIRKGDDEAAHQQLEHAISLDPSNPWALRNLGALLLRAGEARTALELLHRATELNPHDPQAWFGVGQASEATGDRKRADEAYETVIRVAGLGDTAEAAQRARSRLAQTTFRERGGSMGRPDAVMYCLDALQRFAGMSKEEVRQVTTEIALLGRGGLSVNDPERTYELLSLPGHFSGLHLVSLMYVGMKQLQPAADAGFDLTHEYAMAQSLYSGGLLPTPASPNRGKDAISDANINFIP